MYQDNSNLDLLALFIEDDYDAEAVAEAERRVLLARAVRDALQWFEDNSAELYAYPNITKWEEASKIQQVVASMRMMVERGNEVSVTAADCHGAYTSWEQLAQNFLNKVAEYKRLKLGGK